jgi:hypothetical protein
MGALCRLISEDMRHRVQPYKKHASHSLKRLRGATMTEQPAAESTELAASDKQFPLHLAQFGFD